MAQGRETRSFLIFIKEVLQAGCFDGQYIWFFPVTQLPVECLQHTIRGGSLSLSLSLFGVLYSMECHIFLLYSVSWLEFVLGMQKKYFFKQHIYMCIIVVQCFNSNELKIVKNRLRGELHKLQRQT